MFKKLLAMLLFVSLTFSSIHFNVSATEVDMTLPTGETEPNEEATVTLQDMLPYLDIVASEESNTHYFTGPGAYADGSVAYDLADLLFSGALDDMDLSLFASTVPSGTADMRVGKFLNPDGSENAGFYKSNGLPLNIYYSAVWHGDHISTSDATLSRGQYAYCIEPSVPLVREQDQNAGSKTSGSFGAKDYIQNKTTSRITTKGEIFKMLGRVLAICGPSTKQADEVYLNPAEATKYMATQLIIWEIMHGDMDVNFNLLGTTCQTEEKIQTAPAWNTAPSGGQSIKYWHDYYLTLLQNSKKVPSFCSRDASYPLEYTMTGTTLTLTDSRGLLQYMTFTPSDSSVSISVSGNTLTISNPNNVDFSVTTTNTICAGAKEPVPIMATRTLDNSAGQTTIISSTTNLADPVNGYFKIKALNTTVEISKKALGGNTELAGATLQIKDASGNVVDSWTTTNTPHIVTGLAPGNYTLVETAAPAGYAIAAPKAFTVTSTAAVQRVEMYDDITRVQISKTDKTTGSELPGAELQLKDSAGNVVSSWTTTTVPKYFEKLAKGTYTITEISTPTGYVTAADMQITVTDSGSVQKFTMVDDVTRVQISKKDITNNTELPGAILQILDQNDHIVEEWVSTNTPHYIEKLPFGTYTLREANPAPGYTTAQSVRFTVRDTEEIQKVEMVDDITKVEISKKDIVNEEELPGATLQIIDKDGNVVEEWVSTDEPHYIEYLPIGDYILRETIPADGYTTANDVEFTVEDTGEIQKVEMIDDITKVEISKKDIVNEEELPGATLQIIDEDGNVVEEWVSTDEPHYIEYLPIGDYILRETIPADGYTTANDVEFTVEDTGEIQKVEMIDDITKVEISKKDIVNEEELPGATLQIIDEDGNVVEEWVSTDEPHYIEYLPIGDYILREKIPADGYTTANDVEFTIEDTGEIQYVEMIDDITKVEISKKDIVNEEELPGATLQIIDKDGNVVEEWVSTDEPHYIEYLPIGDYILREKIPADGYTTANDVEFTIEDTGKIQYVEMIDDVTKLQIIKTEATTGKPLAGATLQIINKDGKVVDEWVSTNEPHYIEKLALGEIYTLHEKATIEGYILADDIYFELLDTNDVQTLEIKNQREGRVIISFDGKGVHTGDSNNALTYAAIGTTAAAALTILTIAKRRKHEEE